MKEGERSLELLKLVAGIFVTGADKAKEDIDGTGKAAEKASGIFSKVGSVINGSFNDEKVEALGASVKKLNNIAEESSDTFDDVGDAIKKSYKDEPVEDVDESLEKLNERVSEQQQKLDALKKKYAELYIKQGQTADETQEVAKEIEKLSEELSQNKKELKKAKEAADEFDKSLEKVGEEGGEAGKNLKDKWSDALKNFKDSNPVLAKVVTGVTALGAAVVAVGKAMVDVAESTREYRLEMGKLETAFTNAGHTTEAATETYQEFYSILGETDRSVEVTQHLAELCDSEDQLKTMTDALIGVFARWDDSLPLEGLAEAANETAKTGQLTGVLADALNWAGSSEEEFQKKLDNCNTERQRAALIMDELIGIYGEAAATYKKNNKEVIEATKAQEKLNAATARWGEICEPVVTMFKEGLAGAINFAADAFEYMLDPAKAVEDTLVGTCETSEEAAAKVSFFKTKLEELNTISPALWTPELTQQKEDLTTALAAAEAQYYSLVEAEQLAAEEAVESSEATAESVAEFSAITDQYVQDAITLFETFGQTYENMYSKVSGFFKPFEKASVTVWTSVDQMMSAMQSQIDFNNSYTANLEKLKEYGLGGMADAFQAYGAEGSAYAKTIVDAVEKAGGATTEKGQQIIQGFKDINQSVTESQEGLAQTMTLMDGEFEKQLQDMVETYGGAIEDLDKSAEASAAARNTFDAFLKEMNAKIPAITTQMQSFGQQITSSLQSGIGSVSIPVNIQTTGYIPGAKCGMDYVPYDDYLVYLHKGEAVLTAEEAAAWRAGKDVASSGSTGDSGSGGVTVNQYIETVPQTPVELASTTAAYFEQARWIT